MSMTELERLMLQERQKPAPSGMTELERLMMNERQSKVAPTQFEPSLTPEEMSHYQSVLKQPEIKSKPINDSVPGVLKSVIKSFKGQYPEMANLSDNDALKFIKEYNRHKSRLVSESAARGPLRALDLPQALASLATVGNYQPDYVSDKIIRKLKENDIVDLNKEQPLSPSEKVASRGLEWAGSSLGGAGIGRGAVKALNPAVAATMSVPYAGKGLRGVQKTTGVLFGNPSSSSELVRNVGATGALGATAGALEGYGGVSPERVALVGFAPAVPAAAKAVTQAAKFPFAGRKNALGKPENITAESLGPQIRRGLKEKEKVLMSEKKHIFGDQYEQLSHIKDKITPKNTMKYIASEKNKLNPDNKLIKKLDNISSGFFTKKGEPLSAGQLEQKIRELNVEKKMAFKRGSTTEGEYYSEIIKHLYQDLEKHPEVKNIRQQYAEIMDPINKIKRHPIFKKILKKDDFNKSHLIADSEVPQKVINLSDKGTSSQRALLKIIGNDVDTVNAIKAYNFKNLYNSVTDSKGRINTEKLHSYVNKNPGLFIWDKQLEKRLKKVKSGSALKDLFITGASAAGLGALGYTLSNEGGVGLGGIPIVYKGYKVLKNKRLKEFK